MRIFKTLLPATVLSLTATTAVAVNPIGDNVFGGIYAGETSSNYGRDSVARQNMPGADFDRVIDDSTSWGLRVGSDEDSVRYYLDYSFVSDRSRSAGEFREQMLSGSYDLVFSIAQGTRLFGGASVGVTHLKQDTSGFSNDKDWGVHAGLQAGILQTLNEQLELELGYRYAKHSNTRVDFKQEGVKTGEAKLRSNETVYLGLNWHF